VVGYRWPGNVRELANTMDRVAMFIEGPVVAGADLELPAASVESASLRVSVDGFTRARLEEALAEAGATCRRRPTRWAWRDPPCATTWSAWG
jgi:DNA-binding NtrC family response regulator